MRQNCFWTFTAVRNREQLINPVRLNLASPYLEQRTNHAANLTRKERISYDVDLNGLTVAFRVRLAPDSCPVDPTDGSSLTQIFGPGNPFA